MTNISNNLANDRFIALCEMLNNDIYTCLDEAWSDERISKTRKERIKDKFAATMLERGQKMNETVATIIEATGIFIMVMGLMGVFMELLKWKFNKKWNRKR